MTSVVPLPSLLSRPLPRAASRRSTFMPETPRRPVHQVPGGMPADQSCLDLGWLRARDSHPARGGLEHRHALGFPATDRCFVQTCWRAAFVTKRCASRPRCLHMPEGMPHQRASTTGGLPAVRHPRGAPRGCRDPYGRVAAPPVPSGCRVRVLLRKFEVTAPGTSPVSVSSSARCAAQGSALASVREPALRPSAPRGLLACRWLTCRAALPGRGRSKPAHKHRDSLQNPRLPEDSFRFRAWPQSRLLPCVPEGRLGPLACSRCWTSAPRSPPPWEGEGCREASTGPAWSHRSASAPRCRAQECRLADRREQQAARVALGRALSR
jgi:hypothetical protein